MKSDTPEIDQGTLISAYEKSLIYANRKLSKFGESGLLSKLTPEDVANDAVTKTLSGERPWNKEKNPDLFKHLAQCISSDIYNAYTSSDFSKVNRGIGSNDIISTAISSEANPEDSLNLESKVTFIIDYLVATKKELKQVAEIVLREGVSEPKDIAEMLNISVSEVNSKKLALKRLMKRESLILHYILKNRTDLVAIATAMYTDKLTNTKDISNQLDLPFEKVQFLKIELENVVNDIYSGRI